MHLAFCVVMDLGICAGALADSITTGTLLNDLIDMQRFSEFPDPAYSTVQYSSHDRTSNLPGGPGWYANSDGFGKETFPNFQGVLTLPAGGKPGEYVMCDVEGPGAIVRLWTARIGGTLRLYLDGDDKPVYDGPAEAFLKRPYDTFMQGSGLSPDDLSGSYYQRDASYCPIPFAKHCRIVWTGDHNEIHFYEIQVRLYDKSAKVKTFAPEDVAAHADRIRTVSDVLKDPDARWPYHSSRDPVAITTTVPPHAVAEGPIIEGEGQIERLVLKVDAPDIDSALRQVILHIQFDDYPWAQVQAPIGDFFGAAPGINPYHSAPMSVAPDGTMTCRYIMPFASSAHVLFDNRSDQDVTVTGSILPGGHEWNGDTSMHFRARWRVDHGLVAAGDDIMGVQDLPFLIGRGQGVYVGTSVMLLNPNEVPSSGGNWWGEGDEKIFVDDETTPSVFGTGSEDYFNYSWSATDIFMYPYCGQPRNDGPANRGFVVNYRYHILDALPFRNSLAFYMELFSHERTLGISYARIGYHYARPGFMDDHVPITTEDVRAIALPATWEPASRGAVNGFEFHACESMMADSTAIAFEKSGLWQGGQLVVWTPKQAGEKIELTLEVAEKGEYDALLVALLRPGAGSMHVQVNGRPVKFGGDVLKLDAPHRTLSRDFRADMGELESGKQTLAIIAEEAGKPIGLDFFGARKR